MEVYIHIPFCNRICNYCDFCKILYDKKYVQKYLDNLKNEIKMRYKEDEISSIYIGGGTPTSLDDDEFRSLLAITKVFRKGAEIEFTVEGNIESITESKLKIMREYGVNRISLGVESFDDEMIKLLGRGHTREEVFAKIELVKRYFDNINIDLIYAISEETASTKRDIEDFLSLNINHLSAYSLIIEDNTMFKVMGKKNIDSDIDYEMYKYIEETLEKNGYVHYEISNYAKAGYESRHNLGYWNNDWYYGFGLGSVSFIDNVRISNTKSLSSYLKGNYIYEREEEKMEERMENEIFLGLRKLEGIDLNLFKKKYGRDLDEVYNIDNLLEEGYLEKDDNFLRVKKEYIYVEDEIVLKIIERYKGF